MRIYHLRATPLGFWFVLFSLPLLVSLTALAVMIPAGWIFWGVYQELRFSSDANKFIQENVATYKFNKGSRFLKNLGVLNYKRDEASTIELVFMGNEGVPAIYENLEYLAFSNAIRTDFKKLDTVRVFEAKWKRETKRVDIVKENNCTIG